MKTKNTYIKGLLLSLLCIVLETQGHCSEAEKNQLATLQDSLLIELQKVSDVNKRMKLLSELARLNWETDFEPVYQAQLANTALKIDSINIFYNAASDLGRYYCNHNNMDSLKYWGNKVDSVTKARKETPLALFNFLNYYCRYYLQSGEYETAMNEAVRLQLLSEEHDNRRGFISSQEYLGLIYLLMERDRDAIQAFEKGLELLKEGHLSPNYEIQIIAYLVISYFRLNELDKLHTSLDYYATLLQKMEQEKGPDKWVNYPFREKYVILYSNYINLYVARKEAAKADDMVREIASYPEKENSPYIISIYNLAMARYYLFKRDYSKALAEIEKVLAVDYSSEPLETKISILKAAGKREEALAEHEKLLSFIKKSNTTLFSRQLNQLRTLHDLNEKKMQEQRLLFQKEQLSKKQTQLTASLIFSCILLVLFYLLIWYAIHTRRLKNTLQKERGMLLETSKKLRVAKEQAEIAREQAEESNRMKSSFIANISHEIRTPLNAIVGFSELLEDAEEEEKREFVKIIHNNTDLLLKLVNDVLELSHLESASFQVKLRDTGIHVCCQNALNSMRHKVQPGVKLNFTCSDDSFTLKTDPLRLQQLLINLLTNAAKFTEQGEITLDYRVEPEKKQVVFSVTDTGCGIPPEKQETIFNCFEKIDEFKQGAGLGLAISRTIATCFQGSLSVDPAYTHGARFVFIHPIGE